MKISPVEIKQKTFKKKSFGSGYDIDEVSGFLVFLAQEWDKITDENREYKIKVEFLEKEIAKLKEVETSLFKTLKTAEDTSANMVEQARRNAELKMRDAQMKSDAIMNDSRNQAKNIVQKAHLKAQQILKDVVDEIKEKEREYHLLDNYRDSLLVNIKTFIKEMLEKVEKIEDKNARDMIANKVQEAKGLVHDKAEAIIQEENNSTVLINSSEENNTSNNNNSFFDTLEN
ncbi:MAG: DivIVA domain-containing protein [Cytophagales bacterium]|nr:MAG: DivIVA domain-containing protein [Cytophagales bacterium]